MKKDSAPATSLPEAVYVWWSDIDQEWRIRKWDMTPFIEGSKYVREGVAVSETPPTIQRYDITQVIGDFEVLPSADGDWVRFSELPSALSAREPTKVDDILIRLGELEAERKRLLSKLPGVTEGTV